MAPLSLMVAGPVSDWLGVRTWFLVGGCACMMMAFAGLFIPTIMKIEENQQKPAVPKPDQISVMN
jgi:DHA3 family macrolide efflux protein-like MFS transporter